MKSEIFRMNKAKQQIKGMAYKYREVSIALYQEKINKVINNKVGNVYFLKYLINGS